MDRRVQIHDHRHDRPAWPPAGIDHDYYSDDDGLQDRPRGSRKRAPSPPPTIRRPRIEIDPAYEMSRNVAPDSPPVRRPRAVSAAGGVPNRRSGHSPRLTSDKHGLLTPLDTSLRPHPGTRGDRSPRLDPRRHGESPPSPGRPLSPFEDLPRPTRAHAPPSYNQKRAWSQSRRSSSKPPSDPGSRPPLSPSVTSSSGVLGDSIFRYSPLGPGQFRLVRILPTRMSTIKCEMFHEIVRDPPPYIAISYAWGDAGDTRKIRLDGVNVPVAASLHGALQAIRKDIASALVWVDALCIDQQNKEERTVQVQLMTSIYQKAQSIAIWLGPEEDDSSVALKFLVDVSKLANSPSKDIKGFISSQIDKNEVGSTVALFERDYWRRLWVVQEVLNAKAVDVYCGDSKVPWDIFSLASRLFNRYRADLDYYFPAYSQDNKQKRASVISKGPYTYSQVLAFHGPGSLLDISQFQDNGPDSLLEALCKCRKKLSADPRDKVFGILGVLPEEVREEFPPNYSLSVKEVYTDVVDFLITTTGSIDIICEAIHFPLHTSSHSLPSFVPDWSHIPQTGPMGNYYLFTASGTSSAMTRFLDERRNKLEISAIPLDKIGKYGISVGTLCTLADYLMAFLHWRAMLLERHDDEDRDYDRLVKETFCRTICLDQVPEEFNDPSNSKWLTATFHVFAALIRDRLPFMPLDKELSYYADLEGIVRPEDRRAFLQLHFGGKMMGRCFCLTKSGRMGMGTGFMGSGDLIVVPLGCSTPILIRPEGGRGEYRFVGDVYLHGYMRGKAVEQWKNRDRDLERFVIH
ncbi:uncharacterized protein MKZ38_005089 [Zalerion maritima]|uniref:Heterokaryon incompatibility domain-containing protein n=1 Tax=Zalerion maritima TaxID=339359 RepID=A0AAD5WP65_9PEZI|nr:uncharacterized protein MKZ38_005089 [Zalerion maritima]